MTSSPYVPLGPTLEIKIKKEETFPIDPPKQCPFCPRRSYAYKFKTFHGLLKHIAGEHCRSYTIKKLKWIRVYESLYDKWEDIPINSWNHVVELTRAYCKGKLNPSLRMNGERYKKVFDYS